MRRPDMRGLHLVPLVEELARTLEASGFDLVPVNEAEMIVAVQLSDEELDSLRRSPSGRQPFLVLLRKRAEYQPEGADLVLGWPLAPGLLASQLESLRARLLLERSASPLSGLPGPMSVEAEIEALFESSRIFYVTHVDINNFKPFNDAYGFERGDVVIKSLSRLALCSLELLEAESSLCGHVGGDDFVMVTGAEPGAAMRRLAFEFDRMVRNFYTETDLSRRGIVSFDREGRRKRFPLMSISIVSLECGRCVRSKEEISRRLASMKRKAKEEALSREASVFVLSSGDDDETGTEQVLGSLIRDDSAPASWRRAAIEAAGELRMREMDDYLKGVLRGSGEERLRKSAAYSLGRMSDSRAFEDLMKALTDGSAHVRMRSAEALGEMGDSRALEALVRATCDPSSHVRSSAVRSIGRLGIKSAIASLIKATADYSVETRVAAVNALGSLGDPSAYSHLARCIEKGPLSVRRAAAEAMGRIPDARCVGSLRVLLEYPDSGTVWRAAYSINLLARSGLVTVDADEKAAVNEQLLRVLNAKDGHVLWASALALGSLGDRTVFRHVVPLLSDGREYVRAAAAEALGALGEGKAIPVLRRATRDGRPEVRTKAAWALGELGDPAAVETLRLILKDKSERVRQAAAQSICRLLAGPRGSSSGAQAREA